MTAERGTRYPFDLARLVSGQLERLDGRSPPERVLVDLFETLYFASLWNDEGQRPLCTVNFVDAEAPEGGAPSGSSTNGWRAIP